MPTPFSARTDRPSLTPARLTEFEHCPRLLWLTRFRLDAAEPAGADAEARLVTA